jgi:hypothetical protein
MIAETRQFRMRAKAQPVLEKKLRGDARRPSGKRRDARELAPRLQAIPLQPQVLAQLPRRS